MNKELNKAVFNSYAKKYDLKNPLILLKYTHPFRTAAICEDIASRLYLRQDMIDSLWLLGLLHDIARFEQIKRFNSFTDTPEFDHGDYGVKILFQDKMINQFDVDKKYYPMLENGIIYHNKLFVEKNLSTIEKLYCNIIRDADKIDIFYQTNNDVEFCNITDSISQDVMDYLSKEKLIPHALVKSKADKFVLLCALIFDITYSCSLDIIREKGDYISFLNKPFAIKSENEKFKKFKSVMEKMLIS